jgi:hypothetical protein
MEYIGNFLHWIDDSVIEHILTHPGDRRPKVESSSYESEIERKWKDAGIDTNKIGWEFYSNEHLGLDHLPLPIDSNGKKYKWWFSKLMPGDLFPLHVDVYPENRKNIERYWLACEDHKPGHIFISDSFSLKEYKKGDMFKFLNPDDWHGAANIGFYPKVSYQLALFD